MNQCDVSGLLKTYSEKCVNARNTEHLRELIRELKKELDSKTISKMKVE